MSGGVGGEGQDILFSPIPITKGGDLYEACRL
jgi:hypothetical protein